jgi:hypothetical protein
MYSSTHSLTSALNGDEWSASRPGHFITGESVPGTHWIRGWVGPRSLPGLEPWSLARSLINALGFSLIYFHIINLLNILCALKYQLSLMCGTLKYKHIHCMFLG